ncbi:ABC transporter ATP-binding protein [Pelistega sp. MC2]|uniref:ABC transporter ATP-binding protein n=1 Tax=Pelistega sp. MC2 TaxID=1720297 RepID=UPI0008DA6E05|nr:ABC transporter ATP-binding protein [Pelistega sp. MC2]
MNPLLTLDSITLGHKKNSSFNTVIHNLSLTIEPGEIASFIGASGCGKTTLLRSIAGFEPIYEGKILLMDKLLSTPSNMLPPEHRHIGMMFQDYALFPHLTIEKNIRFGLHKFPKAEAQRITYEMLELINLTQYANAYPHQLSGGQQQRVALARAIAPSPKLLLLDEPFSNLDIDTREKLALDVKSILKEKKLSAILVTHHQIEALVFADKIGILSNGQLLQWSTPDQLLENPNSLEVKNYIRKDTIYSYQDFKQLLKSA